MKIKRFSDISLIKESLSKSLEEYCYELFDVGYKVLPPHGKTLGGFGINPRDYFILSGKGHQDDVEKFVDIIESMEPIRSSWTTDAYNNITILCISKEFYNDLFQGFELYFKYVTMDIRDGKRYFYSNNRRNRIDRYDGIEFRQTCCYIAYETKANNLNWSYHDLDDFLICNHRDFWNVVSNKTTTADGNFISLFIKLILFDIFDIEVGHPISRNVPHLGSDLDGGWQDKIKKFVKK